MAMVNSVLEAEVAAIHEGLRWLSSLPYSRVEIETDYLLSVQAINRSHDNTLEVGFDLDDCRLIIQSFPGLSIKFAKRQENKASHLMATLPCLLECQSVYTSPPSLLLETLLYDASF